MLSSLNIQPWVSTSWDRAFTQPLQCVKLDNFFVSATPPQAVCLAICKDQETKHWHLNVGKSETFNKKSNRPRYWKKEIWASHSRRTVSSLKSRSGINLLGDIGLHRASLQPREVPQPNNSWPMDQGLDVKFVSHYYLEKSQRLLWSQFLWTSFLSHKKEWWTVSAKYTGSYGLAGQSNAGLGFIHGCMEARALHTPGRCSVTEIHPHSALASSIIFGKKC